MAKKSAVVVGNSPAAKAPITATSQQPQTPQNDHQTKKTRNRVVVAYGVIGLSVLVAALAIFANTVNVRSLSSYLFGGQPSKCEDHHANCEQWAGEDECAQNPDYMARICTKACGLCKGQSLKGTPAVEEDESYDAGSDDDYADANVDDDETVNDDATDDDDGEEGDEEGSATPTPRFLSDDACYDLDDGCSGWAESGECEVNPGWMLENCKKSCNICAPLRKTPRLEDEDDEEEVSLCENKEEDCDMWAERGECESNPTYMLENCRKACKICEEEDEDDIVDDEDEDTDDDASVACKDNHKDCEMWATEGECDKNPSYMLGNCQRSCKVCDGGEYAEYLEEDKVQCKDRHPKRECQERQAKGECETSPGWMIVFCAKTCGRCDLLLQKARCIPEVFNDTTYKYQSALEKPGDLSKIFESIIEEYPPTQVLLRPPQGPWVLKLPKFVTPEERETILNMTLPNVKRSTDQGTFNKEGIQEQVVSTGRTSSNAWCTDECEEHPVVQAMTARIAKLVKVPTHNFESFQVLQYKKHQKYDVHHDSSEEDLDDLAGPRILTFFIYLSDVEEGGETFFDKLNIKVKPEMYSAILWPSVSDDDPQKIDHRTTHAALPVIKGEKLAANIWIHMRDFDMANRWGCTGSFEED